MTTQPELAHDFRRLATALADAETQPGGLLRADAVRRRVAAAIDGAIDALTHTGKPAECDQHPGSPAHNCGPCRSERIGAA